MNRVLEHEITELSEVVVFGIGCYDVAGCQAMYGEAAVADVTTSGECTVTSDGEYSCTGKVIKTK